MRACVCVRVRACMCVCACECVSSVSRRSVPRRHNTSHTLAAHLPCVPASPRRAGVVASGGRRVGRASRRAGVVASGGRCGCALTSLSSSDAVFVLQSYYYNTELTLKLRWLSRMVPMGCKPEW